MTEKRPSRYGGLEARPELLAVLECAQVAVARATDDRDIRAGRVASLLERLDDADRERVVVRVDEVDAFVLVSGDERLRDAGIRSAASKPANSSPRTVMPAGSATEWKPVMRSMPA